MIKSNIAVGQMFIQFPKPIADDQEKPMPRVWVKIEGKVFGNHYGEDKEEVSLFVDNNALAKFSTNPNYRIGIMDKWYITDKYYGYSVRKGVFVPIDDLNDVNNICLEMGYPKYEIEL
jgi:hypothetical protein